MQLECNTHQVSTIVQTLLRWTSSEYHCFFPLNHNDTWMLGWTACDELTTGHQMNDQWMISFTVNIYLLIHQWCFDGNVGAVDCISHIWKITQPIVFSICFSTQTHTPAHLRTQAEACTAQALHPDKKHVFRTEGSEPTEQLDGGGREPWKYKFF